MKTIKIKNFQSHKGTQLNLHENVNIIVGQSSSGKTAIFRAIEWLNTNRPLGTRFITHGEKEANIQIDKVAGSKNANGKSVYSISGDTYSAGSNVPDVVTQALNLSELNFQNQLSEHFLITSSPGEVARTFNRILNIEQVDDYVSKLAKQVNTANTLIKDKTERIESLTNKIKDLGYLDDLQKKVLDVEERVKLLTEVKLGVNNLTEAIKKVRELEIDLFRNAVTSEKLSKILKEFIEPIKELKRYDILNDLLTKAIELQLQNTINSMNFIRLTHAIESIDILKLKDMVRQGENLKTLIGQFDTCVETINLRELKRKEIENSIELELNKYENEVKAFKICPICFSSITDTSHIMEEVRKRFV